MNSLQKSLVVMSGYDNGWEVASEGTDFVTLTSARHAAIATVRQNSVGPGGTVQLPPSRLAEEMSRIIASSPTRDQTYEAPSERALGELLTTAARVARTLPDLPRQTYERAVAEELSTLSKTTASTEVERMVPQRVGQSVYRESLMDYRGGACAVTGIAIPELLRASHALAWSECPTDADRLNVFNGFLLVAHLDALFDHHLMTFTASGEAVFASSISQDVQLRLGITGDLKLRWVSHAHAPYLRQHRDHFHARQALR
jgi:putative restriction endonuclease